MIKRIRLVRRREELLPREFHAAWLEEVALVRNCPLGVRPARTVACTTLHHVAGADAPHDGISVEWFDDLDALRRFDGWRSAELEHLPTRASEPASTVVIIAEEVVMRGEAWLNDRWTRGGTKYKHMALATRAEHLSSAEFSQRWRSRPGQVGGSGAAPVVAIPDPAKGLAYVQNHPLAECAAYDAINEVYFDALEDMRARIDFFLNHDVLRADADLVRAATFIAVTEHVIDQ